MASTRAFVMVELKLLGVIALRARKARDPEMKPALFGRGLIDSRAPRAIGPHEIAKPRSHKGFRRVSDTQGDNSPNAGKEARIESRIVHFQSAAVKNETLRQVLIIKTAKPAHIGLPTSASIPTFESLRPFPIRTHPFEMFDNQMHTSGGIPPINSFSVT